MEAKQKHCLIVGVAGGSASGKSTFVRHLSRRLGEEYPSLKVESLSTDHYFHQDVTAIPTYRSAAFDTELLDLNHPDGLDMRRLAEEVYTLVRSEDPPDVLLIEGHLLFHFKQIRDLLDVRIFVDLDADTRALRRMVRNLTHHGDPIPNHEPQSIASYYLESAKQGHQRFIEPSKIYADLILRGDADFDRSTGMVASLIWGETQKRASD